LTPLLPKKVLKIAFVVDDLQTYLELYARLFGLDTPASFLTGLNEEEQSFYRGKPTDGRARVGYIPLENIVLEFIEPIDGPSVWLDCLQKNGNGIHHFAFVVDGMEHVISDLEKTGLSLLQSGNFAAAGAAPAGSYAFLEGLDKLGFDVELLEFDV